MISVERERLTLEQYLLLPEYLIKIQECHHCGSLYKECENIGRHLCRIHPGVRLLTTNCMPDRIFHSCCGHSLDAKGCLQIDHSTISFSETQPRRRIAQIRDFATLIVPRLLLRFITPPLPSSVLYDTQKARCTDTFRHPFAVLREVLQRTNELRLTHALQLNEWSICEVEERPVSDEDDEQLITSEYDLVEEGHTLYIKGKESPLFSQLMQLGGSNTQTALQNACDNAWRNRLGEENASSGRGLKRPGNEEKVPFLIVSRIHSKIDVF